MEQRHQRWLGALLLLAGMSLFGSATPISKLVGEHFPVFTASLFRVLLGALFLLPFVLKNLPAAVRRIDMRDWVYVALIALFGMVGFTVLLIYGMRFISGVAGSVIMAFTPALTAAAAWLFLRAPMGWQRALAIALGVAGLVVMHAFRGQFGAGGSEARFFLGSALVLGAIACEAAYTLLGKQATRNVPPVLASFLACVLSLPLFAALAWIDVARVSPADVPASGWWAMLWWGAGTLGAGSALWYSGVARASGTTAAGFMAVMPLTALLLSYVLLDEPFRLMHLPGMALVLASLGLMSRIHARES